MIAKKLVAMVNTNIVLTAVVSAINAAIGNLVYKGGK
jgi:hypothetical protein